MSSQAVPPLRIQKDTPTSSPTKAGSRPLSELGPTERRRNSPSFNQATKKMLFTQNSSPFETSPLNGTNRMASPRLFWQGRDPASSPSRFDSENLGNRDGSPSPTRRSSIENLKRASRVKNSNMFAREQKREYDPASTPVIERPLVNGRPLGVQGNAFVGRGFDSFRKETSSPLVSNLRIDSDNNSKIPVTSPTKTPTNINDLGSSAMTQSKENVSPIKSSLSTPGRYSTLPRSFNPENGTWSGDDSGGEYQLPPGRVLHRHAKSVTFDAAPPQVNEYEMTTPDLSSVGTCSPHTAYDSAEDDEDDESFERNGLIDRDDSFDPSLEDIEKTPVVGPEDWRHMSPGLASNKLSEDIEDPFAGQDGSPMPAAQPSSSRTRQDHARTDSVNSNGERRPLPPIPGLGTPSPSRTNPNSYGNLSVTAERVSNAQRDLPSPPGPASASKPDAQSMEGSKMTLEERLRLMILQDDESGRTSGETQRERRMRRSRSGSRGRSQSQEPEPSHEPHGLGIQVNAKEINYSEEQAGAEEYKLPPRISRESILRRVKSRSQIFEDAEYDCSTPSPSPSPERSMAIDLDPDVPIQSTEPPSYLEDTETSVIIKQEEEESDFDVYSIPEMYALDLVESRLAEHENQEEESASAYAQESGKNNGKNQSSDESKPSQPSHDSEAEEDGPATLRPSTPTHGMVIAETTEESKDHRVSLPEFESLLGSEDFGLGLGSYMTPPDIKEPATESTQTGTLVKGSDERPTTPEGQQGQPSFLGYESDGDDSRRTPDSVIRHRLESPKEESPFVPEPVATIKAPGSRLKTRPSNTPSDMASMAAARRQASGEKPPEVPPIPERHRDHCYLSRGPEDSISIEDEDSNNESDMEGGLNRKRSLKRLDIPVSDVGEDLSFGLDKEFDRLIEAQKVAYNFSSNGHMHYGSYSNGSQEISANVATRPQRGYLMRQNTKLIVASSTTDENVSGSAEHGENYGREPRTAGNSPQKASHDRTKSWSVEPWNGRTRRKSIRDISSARKRPNGVAPPMPGMESNVTAGLENVAAGEPANMEDEGVERGRVFLKVVGVKDLDLPLPKDERTRFCLTLDNGLHCVTTAWLELGRNAPIGQEFELVVLNELEFQLTLQTKIEPPPVQLVQQSPSKAAKAQKSSTFSRVFASPRKRKELERKQQEEERMARQQQEAQSKRAASQHTAWDLLHRLVARDGSFARSYVCLKDYEDRAFGRPITIDVTCFNEWATEEVLPASVKSKRGTNSGLQRRPPYRIGKLELQLLFVPKPTGVRVPELPKSMNACIREMREAEASAMRRWEGHLSQQGGDCPFWRRRFFKLEGSKLTAYHETTRQPRATINLAKASKLIDDRSSLIQKEVSARGGRRKSAFAEEEEGYMFVEEGFRLRFANGEVIDFYADSPAHKEEWMKVLGDTIGKETSAKGWTDMVLAKERSERDRAGRLGLHGASNTPGRKPPPPPAERDPRRHHGHQSKGVGSLPR